MLFIIFLLLPVISSVPNDTERVIIIISDSPLLVKAKTLGLSISDISEIFEPLLKKEVELKLDNLRSKGLQFKVVDILTYALHGAVIETSYKIDAIRSIAVDMKVYHDASLMVNLEKSSELVGATNTHKLLTDSGEPITGKGVVVAILDTGVDYTHPDLGGTIGPDQKVLGGFDFVDDDGDPLDMDGHGTAVAGIIGANGQIKGIAPEVSILAYRVVDRMGNVKSTDLLRALEKASQDGADVINLSLGTKEEIGALTYAVQNIVDSGIVVVAATGNSGTRAFGEPAGRKGVIAVGASLNNVSTPRDAEVIINDDGFELIAAIMNGSLSVPNGVTGKVVYVNFARHSDVATLDLTGKIAIAERGGETGELVYFSEKESNVALKGAIGLIIHNNDDSGLFLGNLIGSHNPPNYVGKIPVVSISGRDGKYLVDKLINGDDVEVTILTHRSAQIMADRVAFFSSIGPVSPFYMKPDIVAPGANVNTTSVDGKYSIVDGTSFATPHVTGAASLLLQLHPDLTPELIAGILSPTSKVLIDQYRIIVPSSIQGSGRLDVFSAVTSPLALDPYYLVFHLAAGQSTDTKTVKLFPVINESVSVLMDVSWNFSSNVSLSSDSYNIDVKDDTPSEIKITASLLDSTPSSFEGRINFRSTGYPDLTLPIITFVNEASLDFTRIEDTFLVSMDSPQKFDEAIVHVISPKGVIWKYNLNYGDSISVNIPYSGEYSIEAEAHTTEGKIYARSVQNISKTFNRGIGIPIRFLEIFGGFMVLAIVVTSIMMAMNRNNQKNKFGME
ncbi:MAG: S8 family serine peptidase [Nitrososphaerales archaeon]|nr:S8 family serine peptidase [Nitrososphaerales archaeon]